MVYRDYLKRQIDELGLVLGKLLASLVGLKAQGQANQGIEIVDKTLKNELNIDIEGILSLSGEELISKIEEKTASDSQLIGAFADILFEMADAFDVNSEGERRINLLKKALILYEHIEKISSTFSFDNHTKIDIIRKELQ